MYRQHTQRNRKDSLAMRRQRARMIARRGYAYRFSVNAIEKDSRYVDTVKTLRKLERLNSELEIALNTAWDFSEKILEEKQEAYSDIEKLFKDAEVIGGEESVEDLYRALQGLFNTSSEMLPILKHFSKKAVEAEENVEKHNF